MRPEIALFPNLRPALAPLLTPRDRRLSNRIGNLHARATQKGPWELGPTGDAGYRVPSVARSPAATRAASSVSTHSPSEPSLFAVAQLARTGRRMADLGAAGSLDGRQRDRAAPDDWLRAMKRRRLAFVSATQQDDEAQRTVQVAEIPAGTGALPPPNPVAAPVSVGGPSDRCVMMGLYECLVPRVCSRLP